MAILEPHPDPVAGSAAASARYGAARRPVVAAVPVGHAYVQHIVPEDRSGPVLLPDPDPGMPCELDGSPCRRPVMLEPGWARSADFDLFHLHFGFDSCSPAELGELLDVLDQRGVPFVFTVHHLRDPHRESDEHLRRQLDVLIPRADALITLTEGAAAEIERRWGRRPQVLPHPHVVRLATMAVMARARARRPAERPFRVGLHVQSLRPDMDPMRILPTLVQVVADLPDAVLQVDVQRQLLHRDECPRAAELAEFLRARAAEGALELAVYDDLSARTLVRHIDALDVSVLPYRFGTHSGWLEACRDLDTTVIAPTCGYFTEQGPVLSYTHDETGFDPASLAQAVRAAHRARPSYAASVEERRRQRREVVGAHAQLYGALLDR
ncbi:glycosyltransferase [Nocardioides sambongensis]|uniref:glycosyltransferase n=1 Tax=Nocardioides sambongensis TaxID=2589074 RepID=UPI001E3FB049|nr:glycosyltransferase [Nocardioides sambongensis]